MARSKKYSAKRLRIGIEHYFDSIARRVVLTEPVDSGRKDKKGHKIYKSVPVLNNLGEKITYIKYLFPPTVGGLCEHLGIHRSTWAEYCDILLHPEFVDATSRARDRLKNWREEQLLTREGKDVRGIIFDLQNNYGYTTRVEHSGETALRIEMSEDISRAGV